MLNSRYTDAVHDWNSEVDEEAAKIDHVWGTSDVLIAWAKAKGLVL